MLSPTGSSEENITHNNNLNGLSSSSTSTSTSSSPSPFYNNAQQPKTMEEVWKDINLASLHDHPSSDHNPNFILQDFFARPFSKDPPTRLLSTNNNNTAATSTTRTTNNSVLYCSTVVPPLLPPPPPATVLSLNSGPVGFDFLENSDPLIIRPIINSHLGTHHHNHNHNHLRVSCFNNTNNSPFEGFDSSSGLPSFGKKRVQESDTSSSDRRHKRMIKNRESAARSRQRKQAYTNQLELERAQLLEENARLKRQQEELYLAAAAQLPKKRTLHRTSTAPF